MSAVPTPEEAAAEVVRDAVNSGAFVNWDTHKRRDALAALDVLVAALRDARRGTAELEAWAQQIHDALDGRELPEHPDEAPARIRDARREASMAASNLSLADAYRTEGREQTIRADRAERERDQARDALQRIADGTKAPAAAGRVIAREALAALGGAAEETGP